MKKVIFKYLTIFLFLLPIPKFCFPQTDEINYTNPTEQICFTPVEVDSIYTKHRRLEISDSLKTIEIQQYKQQVQQKDHKALLDSLEIGYEREKTKNANDRATTYYEYSKTLEPKWYNGKMLYYFLGVISTIGTAAALQHTTK